jgi:lipopolysaccharide biosynthesis regulator YciM
MSAELGLAVAGIAATGAALSKALFDIYHNVRHAPRDIKDIATYLELLRSVLKELQRVLRKSEDICSPNAGRTIHDLLAQCSQIFEAIEVLTAPLRLAASTTAATTTLKEKVKWHFKKDDLNLLKGRLEAIKSTIHLMVSIIQLRRQLSPPTSRESSRERTSGSLKSALRVASELVEGERNCLADLLLMEKQLCDGEGSVHEVKFTRISTWLSGIVGFSEQGSGQSVSSGRSNRTLSAAQRSVTGSATSDVEMLLDKWTTSSDMEIMETKSDESKGNAIEHFESTSVNTPTGHDPIPEPLGPKTFGIEVEEEINSDSSGGYYGDSASDSSAETESRSPRSIAYYGSVSRDSSTSSSSNSLTPTEASVNSRPDILSEISHKDAGVEKSVLVPILTVGGQDDDNETIRDLRRVSLKNRRVRLDLSATSSNTSCSIYGVDDNAAASILSDESESIAIPCEPEEKVGPYGYHTPFSQISILSSQSPSEVGSISTIGENDLEKKVSRLVRTGNNLIRLKKYSEAASLFREAYNSKKILDQPNDAQMLEIRFKIGILFGELGKYSSAERVLDKLLKIQDGTLGQAAKQTQLSGHYLSRIYARQKKWPEACDIYQLLWAARNSCLHEQAIQGLQTDLALRTGYEYSIALMESNQLSKAREVLNMVYTTSSNVRGPDDVKITLSAGIQLGRALRCLHEYSTACQILKSVQAFCGVDLIEKDTCAVRCAHELSMVYCAQGEFTECEPLARLVWINKVTPNMSLTHDVSLAADLENTECFATALRKLDKTSEARDIYTSRHKSVSSKLGEDHSRTIKLTEQLTRILLELEDEYEMETRLRSALVASHPITYENVTEDLTHIAERLGPLLLKREEKLDAADVYDTIFLGEKKFLGIESVITLENGHQYGSLCFDVNRLAIAETVFSEVWNHRKQVLGEKDLQSISSGFQLGQVYFMNNKHEAALSTHRNILEQRLAVFGQVSAEVIESSEVIGIVLVSNKATFENGFDLLREALNSKKEMFGNELTTMSSAFRLASLSASHGRFSDAAETFTWIFDNSRHHESKKMLATACAAGFSAAGFEYLQQHRKDGNIMIGRVADLISQGEEETSPQVRTLAYGQAMLLFLQREGTQSRAILHRQFSLQRRFRGSRDRRTILAGEIFAIGSLMDSLLRRTRIDSEVDNINNWLYSQKKDRPMVMIFAMVTCMVCALSQFDELAQVLLKWLYRTQKRLVGRFDRSTMITLAVHHAFHLRGLYKSVKKISTRDHTRTDPRVILRRAWPVLTHSVEKILTGISTDEERSKLFSTWLPKLMTEWTLYEGYRRDRLSRLFMPGLQGVFMSPQFAEDMRSQSQAQPQDDDVASRIWTVASTELIDGSGDESEDEDETDSTDLSDITDGRGAESLKSLGESLIELVMASSNDDERVIDASEVRLDARLQDLHTELVSEVISESNISAARENTEAFEKEAEAT